MSIIFLSSLSYCLLTCSVPSSFSQSKLVSFHIFKWLESLHVLHNDSSTIVDNSLLRSTQRNGQCIYYFDSDRCWTLYSWGRAIQGNPEGWRRVRVCADERGLGRNQEGSRKTVVWIESLSCNNEVVLMRFVVTLLLECNFCILSL